MKNITYLSTVCTYITTDAATVDTKDGKKKNQALKTAKKAPAISQVK